MRSCYIYVSRVSSAFCVALSARQTASPVYCKYAHDGGQQRHLKRLIYNDFHPIPTDAAPRYIRETFALARGFVPSSSLVTPLVASSRSFSSFHGSAHHFLLDVHDGDVIVFFYKPACGPCAVIRDKIKMATGRDTASLSDKKAVAAGEEASHGVVFQSSTPDTGTSWLNEGGDANDAAVSSMSPEDRAVCEQLRSHLSPTEEKGEEVSPSPTPRGVRFLAVNTNENVRLTALHDVRSLPTFIAYHNGTIVGRVEGAHEVELLSLVKALKGASAAPPRTETTTREGKRKRPS